MKKNGAQKKKRLLWIVIPVAVFALLLSAALIYLESYMTTDMNEYYCFCVWRNLLL